MSDRWTELALEHASEGTLHALVRYQAAQIDRLCGGRYVPPKPDDLRVVDQQPVRPSVPALTEAVFVVEALLSHEDIYRKPPRVAAPRVIQRLAAAGIDLTMKETA